MIRVKTYDMTDKFIDVVATFPKLKCSIHDKPNENEIKESYWNELDHDTKLSLNQERSIQRTKTKVKRYVIHKDMRYMWTLTFAKKIVPVKSSKGITNYDAGCLDDVWKIWKAFMKRCERANLKFDYIVTVEVQEKRLETYGEKVYHFHFATNKNLPIDNAFAKKRGMKEGMLSLWGHGSINVQKQKSKKKFANIYLMKYITKMFEATGKGTQRYRCSQNMVIPTRNMWFPTEEALDFWINKMAAIKDLKFFKEYYPLSNGNNEVLYYGLSPI